MKIYAHRGCHIQCPENSLPAFEQALQLGVDGVELDVLMTKDKVPVVTHNNDLSLLTRKAGFVDELPLEKLASYDLGRGIKIPLLEEVLKILASSHCRVILDLKRQRGMTQAVGEAVSALALKFIPRSRLLFSSFHPTVLFALKKFCPNAPLAWILSKPAFTLVPTAFFARLLPVSALHPHFRLLRPAWVQRVQRLRLEVNSWGLNKKEEWERAEGLGIDGFFTDHPMEALNFFGRK